MNAILSIVVPAYNVQRYIELCANSILAQLKSHHELIVVDDGSSDNTLALVYRLQETWKGSNFHVFSQANQGIAATRNHCIGVAQGDYIVFVDSDDVLLPGSLEVLDRAVAEHAPDVVACDFRMWHPDEPSKSRGVKLSYPVGELQRDSESILNTFFADRQMYIWSNVFKRTIYAQLPAPVFPPGRVFEDVSTVPRLLSQCKTLLHVPHAIIDYRQHPASITRVISEEWCMDFAAALPVARQHLKARNVPDSVQRHFDIAAAYFYIGVIKNSYQLPRAVGRRVRASIKATFSANLFGNCEAMLDTAKRPDMVSNDRALDLAIIGQVKSALNGGMIFHFRQTASRKLKLWRRLRKARKLVGVPLHR